jgi:hypothetical protein
MVLSFAAGREDLHREGDRTARRSTWSQQRKFLGTRIRHVSRGGRGVGAGDVGALTVTVIQSPLGALLVASVGGPSCAQVPLSSAGEAAVGLTSKILHANKEPGPANPAEQLV